MLAPGPAPRSAGEPSSQQQQQQEGPLRILCIHGFRQSGKQFRGRLCALQKRLKRLAQLHFVDGPLLLPCFYKAEQHQQHQQQQHQHQQHQQHQQPGPQGDAPAQLRRCWLASPELLQLQSLLRRQLAAAPARSSSPPMQPPPAAGHGQGPPGPLLPAPDWTLDAQQLERQTLGWADARAVLEQHIAREGPFDGLLGFSQGAAVAAALIATLQQQQQQQQQRRPGVDPPAALLPAGFRFAILCSGYVPACPELQGLLAQQAPLRLPSCHAYSTSGQDSQVPADASRQLAACFAAEGRLVVEHGCGHVIPANAGAPQLVAQLKDFLLPFVQSAA